MPARSASRASASGNVTPSICMMKLKTSPPMSQTQHLNDCRSGLTCRLGRESSCQGQMRLVAASLAAERQIAADQVDDIDGLADPFLGIQRIKRHGPILARTRRAPKRGAEQASRASGHGLDYRALGAARVNQWN